jgi:hypothetical protein
MKKGFLIVLSLLAFAVFVAHPGVAEAKQKKVIVKNMTNAIAQVNINFGADSKINKNNLGTLCNKRGTPSNLNCGFDLGPKESKEISNPSFQMMDFSLAFNKLLGCGATKAELAVNMPGGDAFDVSVVDGFNEKIAMIFDNGQKQVKLGPPCGVTGNEKGYGVFPYGCDICAARLSPMTECGPYPSGNQGCKSGTENKPGVLCQYNLANMGEDNGTITIYLMPKDAACSK